MGGRIFTSDDWDDWDRYYEQLNRAGAYHDPAYLEALAGNYEPPESAELFVYDPDDADGFVYYPYLRRPLTSLSIDEETDVDLAEYSDIVSSWYYGGPICSLRADTDLAARSRESFTELCADRGIVAEFVRFDPTIENHQAFECLDPELNRETVPVDLTGTAEDVWNGYEDRNRRAIEQAKTHDLTVRPTQNPDDVAAFHDIYCDAMEAKDAARHYRFECEFFEELIVKRPELATLLVLRYEGEVIGGFIAVHDDTVAHHYLSASIPDYWDMRVNNLLFHEVVQHFHAEGYDTFDFQGGRPGVFNFKKGFSGQRGEFYLATDTHMPEVYDSLVAAASEAGVDTDTDYFPAYRAGESN